ncbi:ABC transporter permease [Staphylococcus massiliensis]|uniref:ABC transporter permease n=1 Tax=Staphylococcus massiliensis TaxID=555791 RepID=UPI001EDD742B|nr:ABC transporter permease [Staphylococcus massiliensis]MCG3399276.1 ABC transporter permease [Staphylococcus massiliensis]
MKAILKLLTFHSVKAHILFIAILVSAVIIMHMLSSRLNQVVQIPIGVQDLNQTEVSQAFVDHIKTSKVLNVKQVDKAERDLKVIVSRKEAVVVVQIPEDFDSLIKEQDLKEALPIYAAEGFIGKLGIELISQSLYQTEAPYILALHLEEEDVSESDIKQTLKERMPTPILEHETAHKHSSTHIEAGIVMTLLTLVSSLQVVLYHRLNQPLALSRMYMFKGTRLKLHFLYTLIMSLIVMSVCFLTMIVFQFNVSIWFYVISFGMILIYEFGLSVLIFIVRTLSHRIFMAFVYACIVGLIWLMIQL